MKRLYLLLLFTTFLLSTHAQSTKINFSLTIEDISTKRQLGNATAFVFSKKDADIDSLVVIKIMKAVPEYTYYGELIRKATLHDTLYVCTQCDNYEDEITPFIINKIDKSNTTHFEQTIKLRRSPKKLNEAVVTTSKIMMVNKGDTIVYNADYFQLAEGSMLDELIKRLPGVKLESGGRITINGNFVSSLLINGKDFFKGDATVALENLPAYMVNKVKAYQKTPNSAYITRDSLKAEATDPWVIDVNLKRQYSQGWLANAEAGYGTHNRYLGRLFGLRFTTNSHLSVYGNFNNLNNNSRPGKEGDWQSLEPIIGQSDMKEGGLSYGVESLNKKVTFTSNLVVTHNNDKVRTEASSETFLANTNSFVRSRQQETNKQQLVNLTQALSYKAQRAFYSWENYIFYSKSNTHANLYNLELATQPTESYRGALIDSLFVRKNYDKANDLTHYYQDVSQQNTTKWMYKSALYADIRLSRSHYLSLQANGYYSHTSDDLFSQYALFTPQATSNETFQNKYQTTPQHEYEWQASAYAPIVDQKGISIIAAYTYRQAYYANSRNLYRLDRLGNDWSTANQLPLGMLPSTNDSITRAIDYANTYRNGHHLYRHTPEVQFHYYFKKEGALYIFLPTYFEHDQLNDLRMRNQSSHINKHYVGFEPRIQLNLRGWNIEASKQLTVPTMTYLLTVRDDSNPLAIYVGNSSLKATDVYSVSAKYSKTLTKHAQNYYGGANYQRLHNAVGQTRLYNTTTGATTYTPRNINGNWTFNANAGYARCFDAKQQWSFSADAVYNFNNSVDYLQTTQNANNNARSTVRNSAINGNLALRYRQKMVALSLTTAAKWLQATSSREGFATINSLDMLYGLTANVNLPWGMAFNTDCTLHTRSGYADKTMNLHEWIWNAEITKSLLKKKNLILKLRAYDLLHQRHNIVRTLNAQARTETWHNTLPNFVIFTLTYRLHVQPKKVD